MIKIPSFTQIKAQLQSTAYRFPLPTLCAVILTCLGLYLSHHNFAEPETWIWKTLMTTMLGLVSLTALTLTVEPENKHKRGLALLTGTALLGVYYWSLPSSPDTDGQAWIIRHVFLILASFIALIWAPFWKQSGNNKVLWRWCADLIGDFSVTGFFAITLFLGLAAALWSIDMLFGISVDGKLYFDLWVIIAALFAPLFYLSQFAPHPVKLTEPKSVSPFMNIFAKFIMTPIAAGYLVILYTYTAKILITWEWPKNVLGWLVICFLGVAIVTYFLWTPLLKSTFDKYRRIFWLLLLPQILLLFIAIGWRIHAYSWTENRYFVVILGLWLLGVTIYFLWQKKARFKWAFMALTGLILLTQMGPLSGYNIAKKAQTKRLMSYLEQAGVAQNGDFVKTTKVVDVETENQIASALDYLDDRQGSQYIKALFPQTVKSLDQKYISNREIMEAWGLKYRSKWERQNPELKHHQSKFFSISIEYQSPRDIRGYDWKILPQPKHNKEAVTIDGLSFERAADNQPTAILVKQDGETVETILLEEAINQLKKQHKNHNNQDLPAEKMSYLYESERLAAKIYFLSLWGEDKTIKSFDVEMYVRIKQ